MRELPGRARQLLPLLRRDLALLHEERLEPLAQARHRDRVEVQLVGHSHRATRGGQHLERGDRVAVARLHRRGELLHPRRLQRPRRERLRDLLGQLRLPRPSRSGRCAGRRAVLSSTTSAARDDRLSSTRWKRRGPTPPCSRVRSSSRPIPGSSGRARWCSAVAVSASASSAATVSMCTKRPRIDLQQPAGLARLGERRGGDPGTRAAARPPARGRSAPTTAPRGRRVRPATPTRWPAPAPPRRRAGGTCRRTAAAPFLRRWCRRRARARCSRAG